MSEFRDVPGYEGAYKVSRDGRVLGLKKRGLRVMKPPVSRPGYGQVNFYPFGEVKHHYVRRLVAPAFLGPIPEDGGQEGLVRHFRVVSRRAIGQRSA